MGVSLLRWLRKDFVIAEMLLYLAFRNKKGHYKDITPRPYHDQQIEQVKKNPPYFPFPLLWYPCKFFTQTSDSLENGGKGEIAPVSLVSFPIE